jgi:hypothetical protein
MAVQRNYLDELRERAVKMVLEIRVGCRYSVTAVDLRRLQLADVLMSHPRSLLLKASDITAGDIGGPDPESVISLPKLDTRCPMSDRLDRSGLLRAPQKPHNSVTRRPDPTGIPRTKRHTSVHLLRVLKARRTAGQQRRCV